MYLGPTSYITHQANLQAILAFYHMILFGLTALFQILLVKEQAHKEKEGWQKYIRLPHACRK